jgi:hypothetical protein
MPMYKIIGADSQEYGPVSAEQIRQWLAEGRVNSETKVQAEGEGEWKQVADIPELVARPAARGRWKCATCGELLDPQFDTCWRCSTPRATPGARPGLSSSDTKAPGVNWRVEYRMFRGTFATWANLFDQAASFAAEIGRERLIGISHSEDNGDGVVAVWYWTQQTQDGK